MPQRKTRNPKAKARTPAKDRTRPRPAKAVRQSRQSWMQLLPVSLIQEKIAEFGTPGDRKTVSLEEATLLGASAALRARRLCSHWDADLEALIEESPELRSSVANGILLLCCAHHTRSIQTDSSRRYFSDATKILQAAVEQSSQAGRTQSGACRQHIVLRTAGIILRTLRSSMQDPSRREIYRKHLTAMKGNDTPSDGELDTALRLITQCMPSFPNTDPSSSPARTATINAINGF